MAVPDEIARLVGLFEQNRESYLKGRYNETQLRREFIDPFFKALGWDVDNTKGWAEAYKDVIHEDAIRIGSATKAPDYCFRVGGTRKFFVEAKKPAVDVRDDPEPAFQLRRYAWSAKLPLSILTDFEEFAVYDCRVRPNMTDKPSKARVQYLCYRDYLERWEEIASVFSREAVLKGSFDKYAQTEKRKRGTAEVDAAFLAEIEDWREKLARNIALRNPTLNNRELNYAVQITIDRIIFLRICEDRGIERYGELQGLVNGTCVYQRLMALFHKADDRYNSGLFHFTPEKDRPEGPDELTPELTIDDRVLKDILRSLYYPDSPYEFSVLPAEILGHVYEQFLGKVITLTAGHHARVEDKPEVKKAGGVYYTPTYIVDYIVEHTVGKLLEGRCVKRLKTKPPKLDRPLRVLDPACGSGSFLLGAYQRLLDWYLDYYTQKTDANEWAAVKHPPVYLAGAQGWKLTLAERKRILLDHIYGVDIDSQAVEVTKLSLLLRVLEGERQLHLFATERALPDLAANIKCGNSLIGPDFYQGQQLAMFDEEERYRINAFDWQVEFPDVFKDGGFDAVIGNPPYIRVSNVAENQRPYLYRRYDLTHRFDIYIAFIERGFGLLRSPGCFGFIVPNKFITAHYGTGLRGLLTAKNAISAIVDFGDSQVFDGPTTYTCLLFLTRDGAEQFEYLQARADTACATWYARDSISIKANTLSEAPWTLVCDTGRAILDRMAAFPQLSDYCTISHGLQTGYDDVFLLEDEQKERTAGQLVVRSKAEEKPFPIEREAVRRVVKGSVDIRRYYLEQSDKWVLFPYEHRPAGPALIDSRQYPRRFPLAWAYLQRHSKELHSRKGNRWYAYRRRNYDLAEGLERLLVPSIARNASFAYESTGTIHYVGSGGGGGGGYGLTLKEHADVSILYLLGILNSALIDWQVKLRTSRFGHGYYAYNRQYIEALRIRPIESSSPEDSANHALMTRLVQAMLELHKDLAAAKTPRDKEAIERQIAATDAEIDQLVYELYGLTDEEIRIVEEATGGTGR